MTQLAVERRDTVGARVATLIPSPSRPSSWEQFLRESLRDDWRPGEWHPDTWIFVPDPDQPNTNLTRCQRPGCGVTATKPVCVTCRREQKAAGWTDEQLMTEARVTAPTMRAAARRELCFVARDGVRCERESFAMELCYGHYYTWRKWNQRNSTDLPAREWLSIGQARGLPALPDCVVPACEHMARGTSQEACGHHLAAWKQVNRRHGKVAFERFVAKFAEPIIPPYSVPLIVLPERLRLELLFAMQSFDRERSLRWSATGWRTLYLRLREVQVETLVGLDAALFLDGMGRAATVSNLIRHSTNVVTSAYRQYAGDEGDPDVLDARALGLTYKALKSRTYIDERTGPIDLRPISQDWLREAMRHWVLVARPNLEQVRPAVRTVELVSQTLREQRIGSDDPSRLSAADMLLVVKVICERWTARKTQENHLAGWWKIVNHARAHDLWGSVPDSFGRNPEIHKATAPSKDPDEPGQALPTAVMAHLASTLHLAGTDLHADDRRFWGREIRNQCYRAMLTVLRDTGRRPSEVVTLTDQCLRLEDDGSWTLIYDNHKGKRLDRALPLHKDTAAAVQAWRATKDAAAIESKWLFPSPVRPMNPISQGTLTRALRSWIDVTAPIGGTVKDIDGAQIPFDLNTIALYDFRHSYAQRHADAGVDVDDLRRLMDHRSMSTTQVYYRVGWERKRAAADKVAPFTMNRDAEQVGLHHGRRALALVAVPWGGCAEPTNVQAGGRACPIRFQCSGCSFYRPDPSFKPDIERHVAELRMNLAQARAMNTPAYTIENFEGQIADYGRILAQMDEMLATLPDEQRAEIEDASAVLRRARAADAAGLTLPITTKDTDQMGVNRERDTGADASDAGRA